jgi:hypothetical protein
MSLLAMITRPVVEETFCFVDVTLFMSGLPVSLMTGVPMPLTLVVDAGSLGNRGDARSASFSRMSPLDWPLVLGGCGPVANIRSLRALVSMTTIGRVWLFRTLPNGATVHVPAVSRTSSSVSGAEATVSLVFTAA